MTTVTTSGGNKFLAKRSNGIWVVRSREHPLPVIASRSLSSALAEMPDVMARLMRQKPGTRTR